MKDCIKVINYIGCLTLLFLGLTYLFTFCPLLKFNLCWISTNFITSVCSGIFSSLLVVELYEILKYRNLKSQIEFDLFWNNLTCYRIMKITKAEIEKLINQNDTIVPENIFDDAVNKLRTEIELLQKIEYVTFNSFCKRSFMYENKRFVTEINNMILSNLQINLYLKLAINNTIIDNLENKLSTEAVFSNKIQITANCPKVRKALEDLLNNINDCISLLERYLEVLNEHCENRFKWNEIKKGLPYFS